MPAWGDFVVAAFVIDHLLRPQHPHHLNLLSGAAAPVLPVLAQPLVLNLVPAHADAQAQPAVGQHVHLGGLLGHQRRLALRQDDDARAELDLLGERGQVAEHHERLVEHIVLVVGTVPLGALGVVRAQHVVEHQQVLVAQRLGGLREILHGNRVSPDLGLRENGS